jgi:hypothetical protein
MIVAEVVTLIIRTRALRTVSVKEKPDANATIAASVLETEEVIDTAVVRFRSRKRRTVA